MIKHLFWVVCVFAAAACGDDGGSIGIDDLGDEIVGAQCDQAVRCEGIPDQATCTAAVSIEDGDYQTILGAVEDGTIIYDAEAAAACANSISGASCAFEGFHTENPCEDVFKGTVPAGGACFIGLQCANLGDCVQTDPACDSDLQCCPGTCMGMFSESAVGGPCEDNLHFCSTNAYCKPAATSGPGVCTALVTTEGGACDSIDGCANPMYCNLSFTTGTGTCKTPAASNATCSRMDLLPCADSRDYCDATTMKCVRAAAVGAACGAGVTCVDYASCINAVCVADPKAGEACTIDSEQSCLGSLECIAGTCQLPPAGMGCI